MSGSARLVGVVHLGALPGAPHYGSDLDRVISNALADALTLAESGFDALLIENFGDVPYFPDDVPASTVAAMTRTVAQVAPVVDIPVGVNVLRNDALSAIAIAASAGGSFIRVNVLTGTMYTDQGAITGRAAAVARLRQQLAPELRILADVLVKHAVPPPGLTIEDAAADTTHRGGADALIVTGTATGEAVKAETIKRVRAASNLPLYVGSGVTAETVRSSLEIADGVIVGTALKEDAVTTNPVDPRRAAEFVAAAT